MVFADIFQLSISDGQFSVLQLYLFINGLIIETLSGCDSFLGFMFSFFYPVWKINIWTITFKLYLVTSMIQKLNWVENKNTPSYWCFWINLVSWKKLLENYINNFILIFIWHKFYIVPLQVHYTFFIETFRRNSYSTLNFFILFFYFKKASYNINYVYFKLFLFTSIHNFDTFWLTMIFGFKNTHNLAFNSICNFFLSPGILLINQSYQSYEVFFCKYYILW